MTRRKSVTITLDDPSWIDYHIIPVLKEYRDFFPPYKVEFYFNTNIGRHKAHVTSASSGDTRNDGEIGHYICGRLRKWFEHNEVKVGDKVRVKELADKVLYDVRKI